MTERLAVVTGATGGIGRAIATRLGSDGFTVVAHYNRNEAAARELAAAITEQGGRCLTVQADLESVHGVDTVVGFVDELLAGEDGLSVGILVNNAALLLGPSFDTATPEEFDRYFAINVRAPLFLAQQLSRRMAPGGSVVNISSAGAHFSSPGDILYTMTKATIESLTKNMAEAVAPRGIRVNAVVPGFTNNGNPAFKNPAVLAYMSAFALLGGVAAPEVVADAVSFLASDKASRTTGALLDVTGGSLLGVRGEREHGLKALL